DGVVAGVHRLGVGRRALDGDDLHALALERGDHGVVLALHPGEVGGAAVPVVPLLLVVDERLDRRVVVVPGHDADGVAGAVDEHHPERTDVVVDAPPPAPDALLHRLVLEGRRGARRDALQDLVVVLGAVGEAHAGSSREAGYAPVVTAPRPRVGGRTPGREPRSGRLYATPVRRRAVRQGGTPARARGPTSPAGGCERDTAGDRGPRLGEGDTVSHGLGPPGMGARLHPWRRAGRRRGLSRGARSVWSVPGRPASSCTMERGAAVAP